MASKKEIELSTEQLSQLLRIPCNSMEHFRRWINVYWGLDLPWDIVSRYSNSSPLQSLWLIYESAVISKSSLDILLISPRGGYKTLGTAIVESSIMLHDLRSVVHVASTEDQAKRAFDYFLEFISKNEDIFRPMIEKQTMEKTKIRLDGNLVTYEVLPCVMQSLNGPHAPFVSMDELDTLKPEGLKAYKQLNGIPSRHPITGAPPIKMAISTRKSAFGLVQKQMDLAEQQGRKILMWNVIDIMEKCEPSRHGLNEMTVYVNQKRMHTILKEDLDRIPEEKRQEYIPYTLTDGCYRCPISSVCLGDAKNQKCKSKTLRPIDDVIAHFRGSDIDWALAELMCLKPSVEGIVFKEFDRGVHVVPYSFIYKNITGEERENIDLQTLLTEMHKRKIQFYAGVDFGFTAPSTVVHFAIDQNNIVYILNVFGVKGMNDPTFIHYIKTKFHRKFKVQIYYPDVAAASAVDLMKEAGLPVATKIDKNEALGVQVIKRQMLEPGTHKVKFFIANEGCTQLIEEMERYHYEMDAAGNCVEGRFAKEFDHAIDCIRYSLMMLLGKSRLTISEDMISRMSDPYLAPDGSYLRAPTFYELAEHHAIPVMPPETRPFDKKSDEDDDDDPNGEGMYWYF